jgi:hypothetical protein
MMAVIVFVKQSNNNPIKHADCRHNNFPKKPDAEYIKTSLSRRSVRKPYTSAPQYISYKKGQTSSKHLFNSLPPKIPPDACITPPKAMYQERHQFEVNQRCKTALA